MFIQIHPSPFELLVNLIEVVIWPVTLLVILFYFRRSFQEIFKRMGSLKVDSSGIAMTFEKLLEETKDKFKKTKPEAVAKGNIDLQQHSDIRTPFEQVMDIKVLMENSLFELAEEAQLDTQGKTPVLLAHELARKNVISHENSELMRSLLILVNSAKPDISRRQAEEINVLYKAI
ncbi:hypothetical protein [Altibacter lentus]|uniref:hypothetical protein n=1 Tax=Altibacter lentus TaxID=1223410 RepID=UPI0012684AD2|nr:hypothetical protein [Altibacter lentus]